jgi:transcriptional regulator with XRE-family HTH domain
LNIGERLRALRLEKKFSQGEIQKRTGLFVGHISRVENGDIVPTVETLEKFACALEIPMYQLLYDGEEPPSLRNSHLTKRKSAGEGTWGDSGKGARTFAKFRRVFHRIEEPDRRLLLSVVRKMAGTKPS